MKRRKIVAITGYIGFFLLTAAIITVGMFTYNAINRASNGNVAIVAWGMLGIIVVLALIFTAVDIVRRKIMVDAPVGRILKGVNSIASGDFSVKLQPSHPYGRYDEFDEIMENINVLAAELSNVEIFRNDFIANVSHEIKTPLAVIQSYAAALGDNALTAEKRREYAATLVQASRRLSNLVSNILKLNKLENQQISPRYETVNVGESLRLHILELEETFEKNGQELDCDIDDIVMPADISLLEIVWNNLISNAIKFTPRGGSIFISLKDEGDFATLTVKDTGCGMDAATGERIFDKFYQGDASHSKEGNGLGLALVKKVVDILGGEISVKSKIGQGSVFAVRFRKGQA